jgi:hypothetical protein
MHLKMGEVHMPSTVNDPVAVDKNMPDYPRFQVTIKEGSLDRSFDSDQHGVSKTILGDPAASFHAFRLTSKWKDVNLNFEYECQFQRPSDGDYHWCSPVSDGEWCPADGNSGTSHHVRAIRIRLLGNDRAHYELVARGLANFYGNSANMQIGPVGSGEVLGLDDASPKPGWISTLILQIRRVRRE